MIIESLYANLPPVFLERHRREARLSSLTFTMSRILHDSNAAMRLAIGSAPLKPVIMPHSACAFQRATKLAGNERKVFIFHDEGENATAARLQTVAFAKVLDENQIVPYYR